MPNLTEFAGRQVYDYTANLGDNLPDPAQYAYRLMLGYERYERGSSMCDAIASFAQLDALHEHEALIIGPWEYDGDGLVGEVIEALVPVLKQMPNLRHFYFGDISYEDQEISWIIQGDVGVLLSAMPQLQELSVRGSEGLSFASCKRHDALQKLEVQSGGLSTRAITTLLELELPALESLTLWLGASEYGFDGSIDTIKPLIIGKPHPDTTYPFPKLTALGLCNSVISDQIAQAFQGARVLEQLDTLDLSMGTLTDLGLRALAQNPLISTLKTLNISSNYVKDEGDLIGQIEALGVTVIADEQKAEDDYGMYVDVSE